MMDRRKHPQSALWPGNVPGSYRLPLLVALFLITACSGTGGATVASPPVNAVTRSTPAPGSAAPAPSPSSTGAAASVFVIVMENRSYAGALQGQYTASLASQYAVATNYHAVAHPSLPNYLALTSGSTYGIQDDGYHPLPPGGIGKQLSDAGISWRGYMEGMTSDCLHSPYPYALKHDPFAYYGGGCDNLVSMTNLAADLAGGPPRLLWITPGLCNDGHDCSTATADRWLSMVVPEILASLAWRNNGLLLLTWDEADGSATNQVATLAIAPVVRSHMSAHPYNHYSLLATVEDRLGVGRLGAAKTADAMNDIAGP